MVRKFLYFIAFCIVIFIIGRIVLAFYPDELTRLAFKPSGAFEPQAQLAPSAYADPARWIAHPAKTAPDPVRWAPTGAEPNPAPIKAAVFFLHPTSYLEKAHWNAPLDDKRSREIAETITRGIASPFAPATQIWAPRYRQAAFGAFTVDQAESRQALDLAYGDVLAAFDHFVASTPAELPIVVAGHSQGSYHLRRLLAERVSGTPLAKRIAAAYLIGWPVSIEHDLPKMGLPACATPDQSACVVSWLSYGEPAEPETMIRAGERHTGLDGQPLKGSTILCSNPLTGGIGGSAPASANLGGLVPTASLKDGTIKPALASASCREDGILSIGAPPEMGPFVLPGNNFHVYDIPLYWTNLRSDFTRRVAAWKP